jgi:hypothetical protein
MKKFKTFFWQRKKIQIQIYFIHIYLTNLKGFGFAAVAIFDSLCSWQNPDR